MVFLASLSAPAARPIGFPAGGLAGADFVGTGEFALSAFRSAAFAALVDVLSVLPGEFVAPKAPAVAAFASGTAFSGGPAPGGTGGASTVTYCTISEILRFEGSMGSARTRSFWSA